MMKLNFLNSNFFHFNPKMVKYELCHVISIELIYILRPKSSNSVKISLMPRPYCAQAGSYSIRERTSHFKIEFYVDSVTSLLLDFVDLSRNFS